MKKFEAHWKAVRRYVKAGQRVVTCVTCETKQDREGMQYTRHDGVILCKKCYKAFMQQKEQEQKQQELEPEEEDNKPMAFEDMTHDELWPYCPLNRDGFTPGSGPHSLCEGSCCEQAYEKYVASF